VLIPPCVGIYFRGCSFDPSAQPLQGVVEHFCCLTNLHLYGFQYSDPTFKTEIVAACVLAQQLTSRPSPLDLSVSFAYWNEEGVQEISRECDELVKAWEEKSRMLEPFSGPCQFTLKLSAMD